jgi:formyltetrahydrofolate deformylase
MAHAILLISCPDRRGITAAVTQFVFAHNGNIVHADQHIDDQRNTFFMRIEWDLDSFALSRQEIFTVFSGIAGTFEMDWRLFFDDEVPNVAVFVSRHVHCLQDLLLRQQAGHLRCRIPLVISNHQDLRETVEDHGIEFAYFPITPETKLKQEQQEIALLRKHDIGLIVLARYHQILSPGFVQQFSERIINIHHSFLPAFPGKKPYDRAYEKGVKIIGATSHYVTAELDEGPIIEQDTVRVSHRDTVDDFMRQGEDLEKVVLSRAVRLALEHKILCYQNKTVVFD